MLFSATTRSPLLSSRLRLSTTSPPNPTLRSSPSASYCYLQSSTLCPVVSSPSLFYRTPFRCYLVHLRLLRWATHVASRSTGYCPYIHPGCQTHRCCTTLVRSTTQLCRVVRSPPPPRFVGSVAVSGMLPALLHHPLYFSTFFLSLFFPLFHPQFSTENHQTPALPPPSLSGGGSTVSTVRPLYCVYLGTIVFLSHSHFGILVYQSTRCRYRSPANLKIHHRIPQFYWNLQPSARTVGISTLLVLCSYPLHLPVSHQTLPPISHIPPPSLVLVATCAVISTTMAATGVGMSTKISTMAHR
uniref:N5-carboxyaminoimidazole ribonucleotide mutase n=1 Tax=Lygus hesperus TaxID=30085 RepID=A0A0A9YQK1_LYGHE